MQLLDVWASIQMPKYPDQTARALRLPGNAVRVHFDVDVGGSYGVKRGIKHTVLVGYLAMRLGRPVRLIEDRLENMRGGDMHGPDRIFDMQAAFDARRHDPRRCKIRARGRRRRLRRALAAAARQAGGGDRRALPHRRVEYEPISVLTNKTAQEAVRGFGQAPTNFAIERAIDRVARHLGIDRIELRRQEPDPRGRVPVPHPERHDTTTRATTTRCSTRRWPRRRLSGARRRARRGARGRAARGHRHRHLPRAIAAATRRSSRCSTPRTRPRPGWTPAWCASICRARSPALMNTSSSGQGARDAGRDRGRRGAGARSGDHPRAARRLAQRAAVEQPGRQPHGDHARRRGCRRGAEAQAKLLAIAAHNLRVAVERARVRRRRRAACKGDPRSAA